MRIKQIASYSNENSKIQSEFRKESEWEIKKNKERENQKKTTNGTKMRRTDERIIVTTQSMQYILLMPI